MNFRFQRVVSENSENKKYENGIETSLAKAGSYAIIGVQSPNAFLKYFQEFSKKKQSDGQPYKKSSIESSEIYPTIKTIYVCRHMLNSPFFALFAFF